MLPDGETEREIEKVFAHRDTTSGLWWHPVLLHTVERLASRGEKVADCEQASWGPTDRVLFMQLSQSNSTPKR